MRKADLVSLRFFAFLSLILILGLLDLSILRNALRLNLTSSFALHACHSQSKSFWSRLYDFNGHYSAFRHSHEMMLFEVARCSDDIEAALMIAENLSTPEDVLHIPECKLVRLADYVLKMGRPDLATTYFASLREAVSPESSLSAWISKRAAKANVRMGIAALEELKINEAHLWFSRASRWEPEDLVVKFYLNEIGDLQSFQYYSIANATGNPLDLVGIFSSLYDRDKMDEYQVVAGLDYVASLLDLDRSTILSAIDSFGELKRIMSEYLDQETVTDRKSCTSQDTAGASEECLWQSYSIFLDDPSDDIQRSKLLMQISSSRPEFLHYAVVGEWRLRGFSIIEDMSSFTTVQPLHLIYYWEPINRSKSDFKSLVDEEKGRFWISEQLVIFYEGNNLVPNPSFAWDSPSLGSPAGYEVSGPASYECISVRGGTDQFVRLRHLPHPWNSYRCDMQSAESLALDSGIYLMGAWVRSRDSYFVLTTDEVLTAGNIESDNWIFMGNVMEVLDAPVAFTLSSWGRAFGDLEVGALIAVKLVVPNE